MIYRVLPSIKKYIIESVWYLLADVNILYSGSFGIEQEDSLAAVRKDRSKGFLATYDKICNTIQCICLSDLIKIYVQETLMHKQLVTLYSLRSTGLFGLLILLLALAACGGSSSSTPDAHQLISQAQTAFQKVSAYHFNLVVDNP